MEITRQDCFTIIVELLEETLFRAYTIMKAQGFGLPAGVKEIIEARDPNQLSYFEGINLFHRTLAELDDLPVV